MVHFSNGMPTDSLVYGRRQQQYYPKLNRCVGGFQPQQRGGNTYNVSYNFGPPKGVAIANSCIYGLGTIGSLILGFLGLRKQPAQQTNQYAQLNQQPQNNQMQDLIKQQQKQIDDLKKQIEDMNKKQGVSTPEVSTPEVSTPEISTPEESTPTISTPETETPQGVRSSRTRGGSPSGWYRATLDKQSCVKGITLANLEHAESKAGKQTSAATYVLNQVLDTKMGNTLSPANKARLLGEIIRHNPSVFNADGTLKDGANIQKLDVPTIDWIKNKYEVQAGSTQGTSKKQTSMPVQRGNNGYYAQQAGPGGWLYYNPQGQQIDGAEFKKHCPTIYQNTQR